MEDKGIHTFLKGICPKVNVIARPEFELAYFGTALAITPRGHPQVNLILIWFTLFSLDIWLSLKVPSLLKQLLRKEFCKQWVLQRSWASLGAWHLWLSTPLSQVYSFKQLFIVLIKKYLTLKLLEFQNIQYFQHLNLYIYISLKWTDIEECKPFFWFCFWDRERKLGSIECKNLLKSSGFRLPPVIFKNGTKNMYITPSFLIWSVRILLLLPCGQWRNFHIRHSE